MHSSRDYIPNTNPFLFLFRNKMIKFSVNKRTPSRVPYQLIDTVLKRTNKLFKLSGANEISLAVIGRSEMRKLNKIYRGKDKATDVLSFEDGEQQGSKTFLGEILICWPYLQTQAREMHHSNQKEFMVLFIHGLLHLLGYDHIKAGDAKKMKPLEAKILQYIYD